MRVGRLAAFLGAAALCTVPQLGWSKGEPESESFFEKKCGAGIGKREVIGTAGGAAAGAIAGSLIAGEGDKTEGALIGGAIGGFIGNLVGNSWDKKECEKARAAVELALASGRTQSWASDDGKRSLSFYIDNSFNRPIDVDFPVLQGRKVDLTGATIATGVYEAVGDTNVRDRPAKSGSSVFETIVKGTRLAVMAKSADESWLLVSRDGRAGDGWMFASQLKALADDPAAFVASQPVTRTVQVVSLTTSMPCRDMREEYKEKGKTKSSTAQTRCLQGDQWTVAKNDAVTEPAQG